MKWVISDKLLGINEEKKRLYLVRYCVALEAGAAYPAALTVFQSLESLPWVTSGSTTFKFTLPPV
jgi:hypothetical protein